ncbi:head GIN domain-containing protein [Archangium lipolyticum]|uniref:head GIN domain-containing protein n=1 Tax=Archangium lipolyticum TaxID=2970465 RepID=UPI002149D7AD|nr:head GIN domain-containing protein [Archangium lipolyticum]
MLLRTLLLPVALLVSAPAFAQAPAADSPKGQIEVPDFRGVAVTHGIHAEVKPGPKSVRLEGRSEDLARVKLVVEDGVLTTQVDRGSLFSRGMKKVRLYVTNPRVESVSASGGAHVKAEATAASSFEVSASGGSEIEVTGLDTRKLDVAASGGCEVSLKGQTGEMRVEGSGGSVIKARKVQTESLDVSASGGTHVEASPERSLTGSLSGGSTLKAAHKPEKAQVNTSGGSEVDYE